MKKTSLLVAIGIAACIIFPNFALAALDVIYVPSAGMYGNAQAGDYLVEGGGMTPRIIARGPQAEAMTQWMQQNNIQPDGSDYTVPDDKVTNFYNAISANPRDNSPVVNPPPPNTLQEGITPPTNNNQGDSAAAVRSASAADEKAAEEAAKPKIFEKYINYFLYLLYYTAYIATLLLSFIIDLSSRLLDFAFSATHIASSKVVQDGWTFTRDMLNFIFILVLLAISFSTIAGLDTFNRKLLPRLLFAALLVNFSLSISAAFLQVANVMTTTIATSVMPKNSGQDCKETKDDPKIGCRLALGLTNAGSVGQLYTYENVQWIESFTGIPVKTFVPKAGGLTWDSASTKSTSDFLVIIVKSVMAMIMIAVFAIAFVFLGILMFVRLIALVILLVLAPVPYVFSVVPKAQKYADEWWSKFINYTFFLPLITFFLALAIRLMQNTNGTDQTTLIGQFWGSTGSDATWYKAVGGSLVDVIFISVFIFAAVYAAKSLSIFGASGALGIAKGTVLGAGKIGALPARAALNYGRDKTGISATGLYSGVKEGWASRRAGQLAGAKTGASAQLGARLTGGSPARDAIYNKSVAENQKDMKGVSDEVLRQKMHSGGAEGAAAAMQLIENESLGKVKEDKAKGIKGDFSKEILDRIPKTSSAYQKYKKTWVKKDPINAIRNTVAKGDQEKEIGIALSKMDPKDYANLDANDFEAAAKMPGAGNILSKGQVEAVARSGNSKLIEAVSKHVKGMETMEFNPGRAAVIAAAKKDRLIRDSGPSSESGGSGI